MIATVGEKREKKMENEDKSCSKVKCAHCGYIFVTPYQDDCTCRNCNLFSIKLFRFIYGKNNFVNKVESKEVKSISSKNIKGTEKRKIPNKINFYGIVSKERIPIYHNDKKFKYILELANNLDSISTRTFSGTLDKMLIILGNEEDVEEKMLITRFFEKNEVIHILIGNFSDKESDWIIYQVSMFFNDMVHKDKINIKKLTKIEKREISFKMNIQ